MCGIVGVVSFRSSAFTVSERLLTTMRDTMEHIGLDGAGTGSRQTIMLVSGTGCPSLICRSVPLDRCAMKTAVFGWLSTVRDTTTAGEHKRDEF